MRRLAVPLLIVVTACSADPTEAPTSTTPAPVTTTTTIADTTSTSPPAPTTTTTPTTTSTLSLDETVLRYEALAELPFPVQIASRPGEEVSYVITKDGRVWLFDGTTIAEQPVLDISEGVRNEGEQGLLSLALHPSEPGLLYLHYSDVAGDTVVSEFSLTSPAQADPESERVLLQVDQPAGNHNGGMILFTPEPAGSQFLLGLGDGGGSGDRFGNGQNPDTLLGGLVLLNATGDPTPTKYATGLRNPWRFWIDGSTIYVADVGQNAYEEVSVVELAPGHNFGWPIAEGLHCFSPSQGCDTSGQVVPVLEVEHGDAGTCSITGGVVYRGLVLPQLDGHYFYSDYCGGYLRSLRYVDGEATDLRDWTDQVGAPGGVTGFGLDGAGEMYVTTTDQLLKVIPAD